MHKKYMVPLRVGLAFHLSLSSDCLTTREPSGLGHETLAFIVSSAGDDRRVFGRGVMLRTTSVLDHGESLVLKCYVGASTGLLRHPPVSTRRLL